MGFRDFFRASFRRKTKKCEEELFEFIGVENDTDSDVFTEEIGSEVDDILDSLSVKRRSISVSTCNLNNTNNEARRQARRRSSLNFTRRRSRVKNLRHRDTAPLQSDDAQSNSTYFSCDTTSPETSTASTKPRRLSTSIATKLKNRRSSKQLLRTNNNVSAAPKGRRRRSSLGELKDVVVKHTWRKIVRSASQRRQQKAADDIDFDDIPLVIDMLHIPSTSTYTMLHIWLKKCPFSWIRDFLDNKALQVMLKTLAVTVAFRPSFTDIILQIELVKCIKTILNREDGLDYLTTENPVLITELVYGKRVIKGYLEGY